MIIMELRINLKDVDARPVHKIKAAGKKSHQY